MRSLLFLAAVLLAIGVLTNVVEIKIYPDRIAQAPSRLITILRDRGVWEQVQTQGTQLKNWLARTLIKEYFEASPSPTSTPTLGTSSSTTPAPSAIPLQF